MLWDPSCRGCIIAELAISPNLPKLVVVATLEGLLEAVAADTARYHVTCQPSERIGRATSFTQSDLFSYRFARRDHGIVRMGTTAPQRKPNTVDSSVRPTFIETAQDVHH